MIGLWGNLAVASSPILVPLAGWWLMRWHDRRERRRRERSELIEAARMWEELNYGSEEEANTP